MGVQQYSLDILYISIVLDSTLVKSLLLAQGCNFGFIVKSPDFHLQNALNDLGGYHDVDFKDFSLVISVFWSVFSHAIEKEGSELLDAVSLEEKISNLMNV